MADQQDQEVVVKNPEYHNEPDEKTFAEILLSIKVWIDYVVKKWVIVVVVGLLGGTVGVISAYLKETIYTATLSFALEDEKASAGGGSSGLSGLASQFGLDMGSGGGGAFSGANLLELMKSRTLVEKTLLSAVTINGKETSLAEFYIEFNDIRDSWKNKPQLSGIHFLPAVDIDKFSLQQDSILGQIYQSLINGSLAVTQKDKKIGIIYVEVKSKNELFAKLFAENLAKEVSDFYIEIKSMKSKLNVSILEKQVDSIRKALNAAISGVATATDNTFNLNPGLNIERVPSAKRQVDVQANTAMLTSLISNLELAKVSLRKETPLIQVIDKPILPLYKERASKSKGLITGGLIGAILAISVLVFLKWWKELFSSRKTSS